MFSDIFATSLHKPNELWNRQERPRYNIPIYTMFSRYIKKNDYKIRIVLAVQRWPVSNSFIMAAIILL